MIEIKNVRFAKFGSRVVWRALNARISSLTEEVRNLKAAPKSRDRWDKFAILAPVIQALLLAWIGYYLTGEVTSAIQQKQLELSNVKEMQPLLEKLGDKDISEASAQAAAMGLAAFRGYAILPLVQVIRSGGINAPNAAENGLRAIGLTDHEAVCIQMANVISNRTQLHSWSTHKAAIEILGDLDCKSQSQRVSEYKALLGDGSLKDGLEKLKPIVSVAPDPRDNNVVEIRDQLDRTLKILQQRN